MSALNLNMLQNASGTGPGPAYRNETYNLLIAQIEGRFTGLSLVLEGRTDVDGGSWEMIAGWSMSQFDTKVTAVEDVGIYEFPIEGVREIRFRILAITDGSVSAACVFYNSTEPFGGIGGGFPGSITFGDPALFVKGVAEQIFFDPTTGNIAGYDRTATAASVTISVNLSEITGGMGNRLIGVLPDTERVSGSYTSGAFSLETRERIMGGEIAYNAVSMVCETVTAEDGALKVSGIPAPSFGEDPDDDGVWCYVRPVRAGQQSGVNVTVDPVSGIVGNYSAEDGERYEVTYFSHKVSAQMLPIPTIWNPVVMTVQERFGVYSKQNGSTEKGILRGWLYFIVPRAILNADAGASAGQDRTSDTDGSWIAIPEKPENMPLCNCSESAHPVAYYVYVPCADENDAVSAVVSVGNGLTLNAGRSAQLPLKLVMPDDSLVQPDFSRLGYYSEDDAVATVDNYGVVKAVSEGETVVHAYITKSDRSTLDCETVIVVEGTRVALTSNRNNILIG